MTRASDLAKLLTGGRTLGGTGEVIVKDIDTADGSSPKITLQTGDTDIASADVLGTIDFQAPDEGTGTDAILVAAGIEAVSEGDFSSSSNATSLVLKTGASEAATEKVRVSSSGNVAIGTTDTDISGNGANYTGLSIVETVGTRSAFIELGDNQNADGGNIGDINFVGHYQNSSHKVMGSIGAVAAGSTSGQRGSTLRFKTKANGSSTLTERMRVLSDSATVQIGGTTGKLTLGNNATYHADIEWEYDNNELAYTINNVGNHTFNGNGSEIARFTHDGKFLVGTTDDLLYDETSTSGGIVFRDNYVQVKRDDAGLFFLNRTSGDGGIILFYQDGNLEGQIAVSGSTVSYNGFSGLHESSGIPTDTPKGTVVSTIDELDVYSAKQGEVGEETDSTKSGQTRADHAKVEVSNTTGDKAVYGVVGSFNAQGKVNVVSVGVGSVRVTGACAKGDLLESNGDGTAKVQSDDIVRSKTLGKVTIGNSSTDEKLVSCVLYCG